MAQRILFKDSGLGNSNNPLSGYKFVGYNGLTFSQLDSDGNITPISGSGGSGAVSVDNGLSIESGDIILGGTMSIDTSLAGEGNRLSLSNFSRITADVSDRFSVYAQSGNGYTSGFSGNDSESSIGYSDSLILGTSSVLRVTESGISMQSRDNGGAYSSIGVYNTPESVNDGSTDNTFIINDPLNSKGLVYLDDYSTNFTTYSLVTKGYVDALSFGGGLSGTGTTDYLPKWTGSSTLGNSIIRENGSVIAIGITPSTLFTDSYDDPASTYYLAINDTRNTSYSESLRINSLGGSFSKGLRISTQNHYQSWGILVQNKTKNSSEQAFSIGTSIYGTAGGGVNISNTIGRNYAFPAVTQNSNIFNYIANDYSSGTPTGAVINIYNENNADGANLYGVKTSLSGTVSGGSSFNLGCAYEALVTSRSTGKNYGLLSTVSGNSDYGNFGVYIETSHPSDNSKSYGVVVDSGKSIFNDGSNSYSDFQIKGDNNNNLFYVDVSGDNIGIGTSTPDSQAILDLSSTTKGFLPPRMTADQANAAFGTQSTAPEGMLVYITATSSDPAVAACFYNVGWFGRLSTAYWGNTVGWVELTWQVLS